MSRSAFLRSRLLGVGGADTHSRVPGVTDHTAANDALALALALVRRMVAGLNRPKTHALELAQPREPHYDPAELYGAVRPS